MPFFLSILKALLVVSFSFSFCGSSLCAKEMHQAKEILQLEVCGSIPPLSGYEPRRLLITGCARSGTCFVSRFFKLQGFDVAHERDGAFGIVSWTMAADADETPWGPGSRGYLFEHTFHQVRDPLKTIASVSNEPSSSWLFIEQFIPEISPEDLPLVKGAKYWYYWNLMAEKKAEWTYKIEDFPELLGEIERRLEISLDPSLLRLLPTTLNTRRYKNTCTWHDLKEILDEDLFYLILEMAQRYGYEVEDS